MHALFDPWKKKKDSNNLKDTFLDLVSCQIFSLNIPNNPFLCTEGTPDRCMNVAWLKSEQISRRNYEITCVLLIEICGRKIIFISEQFCRWIQFPTARSPLRINSLWWPLIYVFVGPHYGTCFFSPFWRLQFWGASRISEKKVHSVFNPI